MLTKNTNTILFFCKAYLKMHHPDNLFQFRAYFQKELTAIYKHPEIDHIFSIAVEDLLGLDRTNQVMTRHNELTTNDREILLNTLSRLKKKEPIQYIIGFTYFYDLKLKVNPDTLIPRQETEVLIREIVKSESGRSHRILDVGTGSGCIALSLKHQMPESEVMSMDVSQEALAIARKNAAINKLDVGFINDNILDPTNKLDPFSVIVSNPPYVRNSEKQFMHDNVLNNEPHLALFVDDSDPLIFYRAIAIFAEKHLLPQGTLWVEINEAFGKETCELFESHGFIDSRTIIDLNGKDRFVKAKRE